MGATSSNLLDQIFGTVLSTTPFYAKGWGDRAIIERVLALFDQVNTGHPIEVRWLGPPQHHRSHTRLTGYFASPIRLLSLPLPVEAQTAYFELILPPKLHLDDIQHIPLYLHLAPTADQGFATRRRFSLPLLKHGIGALILENPYYGWRRPSTQRFVAIETIADQFMMNLATVLEAHALLRWFYQAGMTHLGVTGYSMGGYMSGYISCTSPVPLATVACGVGISAEHVFTDYVLQRVVDWDALVEGAGDQETAKKWMRTIMGAVSFREFEPPQDPDITRIISPKNDAIIPTHETEALSEHWSVPVQWMRGGHITGPIWGRKTIYKSLIDTMGVMMHKY